MELSRRAVGVATWKYGALEARCSDEAVMEAGCKRCLKRGMELRRHAVGVATEVTSSGGTLLVVRYSYGGRLQACRRGDKEVWRSEARELGGHASGLGTSRCRCAAGLGTWMCRGVEISSS